VPLLKDASFRFRYYFNFRTQQEIVCDLTAQRMKAILLFLITLLCFSEAVNAQTGNAGLDSIFAHDGILIDTSYSYNVAVADMKLLADGKILVVGPGYYGTYVAEYLPNGTLYTPFGTSGVCLIDSFIKPKRLHGAVAELQQDGKILVAGNTNEWNGGYSVWGGFVARLNADGSIDSAFGNNGIQYTKDETTHMCLKPDGSILTAGEGINDILFVNSFNSDGAIDSAFGVNGVLQITPGYNPNLAGFGILADGRIALVGVKRSSIFYIRLLSTGHPDTSFCGIGVCFTAGALYCHDAIIFPNGEALVTAAGLDDNSSYVSRLKADATPDSSFSLDLDGIQAVSGLRINRILQLPDGRIICAGMSNEHFALARILKDGKGIDSSFGNKGIITTSVAGAHYERIYALSLQTDGKILAGGDVDIFRNGLGYWEAGVALVRYLPDAPVGINESRQSNYSTLNIYPNPSKTLLNVNIPVSGLLQLYNTEGRVLWKLNCKAETQCLNISSLPLGTYLLRLQSTNRSYSRLFIKN
jgi:uncharacterized delta-60 repeat protein